MKFKKSTLLHLIGLPLFILFLALVTVSKGGAAEMPEVKMSKHGICHSKGGRYYSRTKNYTSYPSLKACINAGGTPARN